MTLILVADDNEGVRGLLAAALGHAGFDVRVAGDGEEAWGLLQTRSFDAVVTDVHLPGRSGLALLRGVRADARLRATPVIVVSGDPNARDPSLAAGADACLIKPFSLVAVGTAVADAIAARAEAAATRDALGPRVDSGLESAVP